MFAVTIARRLRRAAPCAIKVTRASGGIVQKYSADDLHAEFGEPFILLGHEEESHHTPGGSEQKFVYCFCRKVAS